MRGYKKDSHGVFRPTDVPDVPRKRAQGSVQDNFQNNQPGLYRTPTGTIVLIRSDHTSVHYSPTGLIEKYDNHGSKIGKANDGGAQYRQLCSQASPVSGAPAQCPAVSPTGPAYAYRPWTRPQQQRYVPPLPVSGIAPVTSVTTPSGMAPPPGVSLDTLARLLRQARRQGADEATLQALIAQQQQQQPGIDASGLLSSLSLDAAGLQVPAGYAGTDASGADIYADGGVDPTGGALGNYHDPRDD